MNIASFPFDQADITGFKRLIKKPKDCAINVLNLLKIGSSKILDDYNAELMRIAVGDIGLSIEQIEDIFKYIAVTENFPYKTWKFFETSLLKDLLDASKTLQNSHVMFCGYNDNGNKHFFLIGKTNSGNIMYIDPYFQLLCDLKIRQSYLEQATSFFVLFSGP